MTQYVSIPTYEAAEPDRNPLFLEKRVYQGSSGKVYPHPVIDKISDEKIDKGYKAVFLENDYLKIMILPELGGRVQRAYDKTRNYDFVYYNQVIKACNICCFTVAASMHRTSYIPIRCIPSHFSIHMRPSAFWEIQSARSRKPVCGKSNERFVLWRDRTIHQIAHLQTQEISVMMKP